MKIISRAEAVLRMATGENNRIYRADLEKLYLDDVKSLKLADILEEGEGVCFILWESEV